MSPRRGLDAEAVLDAAERLADERGFDAVTVHEVARALEVRAPSLYHHVDGLDAIRDGLRLRGLARFAEMARDTTAGLPPREALRAFARAQRRFAHEHPGLYGAAQITVSRGAAEPLRETGEVTLAALVGLLRDGYGLEGDAALHAVRILRSGVHGFIALERAAAFGMDLDVDASFARLLDALDRGLEAMAAEPSSARPS